MDGRVIPRVDRRAPGPDRDDAHDGQVRTERLGEVDRHGECPLGGLAAVIRKQDVLHLPSPRVRPCRRSEGPAPRQDGAGPLEAARRSTRNAWAVSICIVDRTAAGSQSRPARSRGRSGRAIDLTSGRCRSGARVRPPNHRGGPGAGVWPRSARWRRMAGRRVRSWGDPDRGCPHPR